ncbi:MAG: hypothetical protein NT062_27015 [Proteobacteria bacterium]|nr:hypothetical protein [Pseudomonadota bacterium]
MKRNGVPGSGTTCARGGRNHSRPRPIPSRGATPPPPNELPRYAPNPAPALVAIAGSWTSSASASSGPRSIASPPGLTTVVRASCSPASGAVGSARPSVGSSA